jgi:opacity protein-like surface antigen
MEQAIVFFLAGSVHVRNSICMKRSLVLLFVAGMSLAAPVCGARAEAPAVPPSRWAVARLQGIMTIPLGGNNVAVWNDCGSGWLGHLGFDSSIDTRTSGGVLGSFEYVLRHKYGLEIGLTYWRQILTLWAEAAGYTVEGFPNFILPTLGANYHFLTDEKKDIYGGALCTLGVIATGSGSDVDVSKDVALGLSFGMDYYVKDSWSVGAAAKYIDFGEIDFSLFPKGVQGFLCDNGLIGLGRLNVVSLTIGIGYRF